MMVRVGISRKAFADRKGIGGAALMLAFAAIAGLRWAHTGRLFYALLLFRDALWAVFLMIRRPALKGGSRREALLAYVSTGLPLLYFSPGGAVAAWRPMLADVLAVVGFLLATLATIELGRSVGVSPASRGEKCQSGVYRWFRHPMYLGYIVAEVGWILIYPVNAALFTVSLGCYLARMWAESRLFERVRRSLQ